MKGSQAYLDPRRKDCKATASQLSVAVAGIGYQGRRAYAERLLGLKAEVKSNEFMELGQELEAEVAQAYADFTNSKIRLLGFGLYAGDPRFGASPDYEVLPENEGRYLLEVKTTQIADWPRDIPVTHLLQMLGQCVVFGCSKSAYICYHTQLKVYHIAHVTFDPTLWTEDIYPRLKEFMDMVERKELPPARTPPLVKALVAEVTSNKSTIKGFSVNK